MDQRIVRTRPTLLTDLDFNVCLQREGQHRCSMVEHRRAYLKSGFAQKNTVLDRIIAHVLRRWIPALIRYRHTSVREFRHFKTRCSFSHAIPMGPLTKPATFLMRPGGPNRRQGGNSPIRQRNNQRKPPMWSM